MRGLLLFSHSGNSPFYDLIKDDKRRVSKQHISIEEVVVVWLEADIILYTSHGNTFFV